MASPESLSSRHESGFFNSLRSGTNKLGNAALSVVAGVFVIGAGVYALLHLPCCGIPSVSPAVPEIALATHGKIAAAVPDLALAA
jgi:hypothetical protein